MEQIKHRRYGFMFIFSVIISLGLVSFVSCIVAETKKPKRKDLKVDGKLCYLPGNEAYGFGIAALICLSVAQIIGNLLICRNLCCSREKRNSYKCKKPIAVTTLLVFSWISFGVAVILIGAATSMSRRQTYGRGWLDRECYLVKDGVFFGSGVLALVTIGSNLGSAIISLKKTQVEQGRKVHAQIG
ncbi:hypothetical protein Q3G72_024024 [Acer saccharum]|nr:hypothetical protein Q3G72_024024 [Acer saccharum]